MLAIDQHLCTALVLRTLSLLKILLVDVELDIEDGGLGLDAVIP